LHGEAKADEQWELHGQRCHQLAGWIVPAATAPPVVQPAPGVVGLLGVGNSPEAGGAILAMPLFH